MKKRGRKKDREKEEVSRMKKREGDGVLIASSL